MNLSNINKCQIRHLQKLKLTLTHLWVLHMMYEGENLPDVKEKNMLLSLGLITEIDITDSGSKLYEDIKKITAGNCGEKKKVDIPSEYDDFWKRFWKDWPSRNGFTWKGQVFTHTRSMKSNEAICRTLYLKAISIGYKPEQILHAKRAMFTTKMEESYRTGKNQVQYLNNMETWLRQGGYKNWIDAKIIEDKKEEEYYQNQG